ncbi:MAG: hypothetical protein M1834_001205 [Cirrosporium novae-zelandiae]|nr:MAG: hypothetical protein M1834_001205 [Cirrosporium novae-zelandiae]
MPQMLNTPKGLVGRSYYLLIAVITILLGAVVYPNTLYAKIFLGLFVFRYLRLVIGMFAYQGYTPNPIPRSPTYSPLDVTVIIPTVEPYGQEFEDTVRSALATGCSEILVATVGQKNLLKAQDFCTKIGPRVSLIVAETANKRIQLCRGLEKVKTKIVVFADDHVFWPAKFLRAMLSPFEDPSIGGVACGKRVRRATSSLFSPKDFWNFIGCLYLERHNFDLASSNKMDGGVFVISGRTAAYRSEIVCRDDFQSAFMNEMFAPGLFNIGPLNADDDNFITRWLVSRNWGIKFQSSSEALMETTLGVSGFKKFNLQCLRWVRTTWRSNSTSLFADRTVWKSQPWCVYAVYITSFFNFALFTDAGLIYLCRAAALETGYSVDFCSSVLGLWILLSKLVKPFPHFCRHPRDLLYLPMYILFGYYHSLLKLYALFTVSTVAWGSRPGVVN